MTTPRSTISATGTGCWRSSTRRTDWSRRENTAARQSDEVTKNDKFTKAAESLRRYIDEVTKMPAEGLAAQVTADLLTEFTGTLIEKITAEAK